MVILNLHGTVVKPVAGPCLTGIYRYAVQRDISVHPGFLQRSVDVHPAIEVTGKGHHFVGHKSIGNLHREVFKRGSHFQRVLSVLLRQYAVGGHHFPVVITEICIQIMRSALIARQPCGSHTDVSYMLPLIGQFIDIGFG